MSLYKPIDDLCQNCGRPPREHVQYRDAQPAHCPVKADQTAATEAAHGAGVWPTTCAACGRFESASMHHVSDPQYHRFETPPRGTPTAREALASARLDGETVVIEERGTPAPPETRISPENQLPCSHCGAPDHTAKWHGARISPQVAEKVSLPLDRSAASQRFAELLKLAMNQSESGERHEDARWQRHFTCLALQNLARAVDLMAPVDDVRHLKRDPLNVAKAVVAELENQRMDVK